MGAMSFSETARGKTVREAFDAALSDAKYRHGHGGYSGSLAEKRDYVEYPVPAGMEPAEWLRLIREACHWPFEPGDERWCGEEDVAARDEARKRLSPAAFEQLRRAAGTYDNKWGPAVAVPVEPGVWAIIGTASS